MIPPEPATGTPDPGLVGPRSPGHHARLRSEAAGVLRRLVAPGTQCALVDFPLHANIGDSVIWLGERALLGECGASIAYVCDQDSFSATELAACLPEGTIFLHGGGNLGDVWPEHQQLREQVIRSFPGHRIIQLPQSIHFSDRANLDRARAVFDAHPALTLLLRDRRSFGVARQTFRAPSLLSPDHAFGITRIPGPFRQEHRVLWLSRSDHESAGQPLPPLRRGVHQTDWMADEGADTTWLEEMHANRRALRSAYADHAIQALCRAYDHRAELQMLRGCRLLGSAGSVVTDRLHAHILSLLLGVPNVLLGDRHGKTRSYWETWTHDWPDAAWADSPGQALEQGERMADARRRQDAHPRTPPLA